MTEKPRLTAAKREAAIAREQRLGQALRDNLRRRKEQARGQKTGPEAAAGSVSDRERQKPPP